MLKKAWKIVLAVVLALLVVVLGYVAYVFIDYHRIGNQELTVERNAAATVEAGKEYGILSYNIGFGAYEDDYSFFMDGGTESRAWSEERLTANIERIGAFLQQQDADLYLLQEVDRDSTRSYHVDEGTMLTAQLPGLGYTWAQNYDSPYLFYPLDQPHGKSVSGLLTLSSFGITETRRVELPIEAGVMKLVDLDRCYSVHRIPAADGRELVLYNVHLSAYTSDGTIAVEQLELLRADMQAEYEKGNWCIAGGDFNKDLLGQSEEIFGGSAEGYTWAQPLPEGIWDGTNLSLVAPLDETDPVPSCRNADAPYHEGQYVLTVDGFVVSDNVTVEQAVVEDTGFAWSDHNPVSMRFVLNLAKEGGRLRPPPSVEEGISAGTKISLKIIAIRC